MGGGILGMGCLGLGWGMGRAEGDRGDSGDGRYGVGHGDWDGNLCKT